MRLVKKLIKNKVIKAKINGIIRRYRKYKQSKLPDLTLSDLKIILVNNLGINEGDTVFVHSSLDKINLKCSPFDVLNLLLELIGDDGNLLFPTYPNGYSYNFLTENRVFNQRLTPSSTGILSEIARRHKGAERSLHPTKSVVAIGKDAKELTSTHHLSPYPYDSTSPYFKINKFDAKIIGLGIKTTYLSCVHTVDDTFKDEFAVEVYHKQLFDSNCVNIKGEKVIIQTYAHDMNKMIFDLPKYFSNYIPKDICSDMNISGYDFFRADSKALYTKMIELYNYNRTTIYPLKIYRSGL